MESKLIVFETSQESQNSSNGGGDAASADGEPVVSRWEMMEQTEEKLGT